MKINNNLSRRSFLKKSAASGALIGGSLTGISAFANMTEEERKQFFYELQKPENIIYSACLQCHNACSIKGKIYHGKLGKIDGNPYGPQTMLPHIDYKTTPEESAMVDGKVCPKGQAGLQTLYDPYRIRKVLKRKGKRGANQWESVDFHQAIQEIVNGGDLFGEGKVKGLKDIIVLKDPKLAKEMAADAKNVGKGKMSLAAFKLKYASHLDKLIDPDHPDLGPKNNKFVMMCGRIEHGRKEIGKRFTHGAMGSNNFFEHTTICEQSHHIAYKECTNQWVVKDGKGKWTGGKTHLKPDFLNAEFAIFFGTGAFEANFGKTSMAQKVTDALVDRNFKMAVVDPRMSQTAAKAKWWVPVKPGTDAAYAWGMIRWIIENERYDEKALRNSNYAAAKAAGETSITDASLLVKIENGKPTELLRASEIGIGKSTEFVTLVNGKPVNVDLHAKNAIVGDLMVDTTIKGIKVSSSFQLVVDEAMSKPLGKWAEICGVAPQMIMEVAKEFTAHGKKAAVDMYRGAVQHTNGYYTGLAIIYLNMLIGNVDWLGGLQKGGGHWHEDGSHGVFNVKSENHPNKLTAFGPPVTREKSRYEDTSLFRENGYPAKRQWYPHSGNIYQEILPSGQDGYPYNIDFLFLHKGTPLLSTPAGNKMIEYVSDPKKLPLFIASDIIVGESSMFADYIFPDTTYMERWGTPHTTPDAAHKASKVRQPLVPSFTEMVEINGEKMPINLEAVYIAIADQLKLSGFGENAFDNGLSFKRSEDWYLKLVANIAIEGTPVPDATEEDIKLFTEARRHFPKEYFSLERYKEAVGGDESLLKKVIYVLNRGGRYQDYQDAFKSGDYVKSQMKGFMKFFVEHVAKSKNAITGNNYNGLGIYQTIRYMNEKETGFEKREAGELRMSTFKEVFGGQSRTISNYWTQQSLKPENVIYMNKLDADQKGIVDNDWVTIKSKSNKEGIIDLKNGEKIQVKARVRVIQGIRPGVVTMSWHFGHWAYGSSDIYIDGEVVKGDIRRKDSACPNPVLDVDQVNPNTCLTDPIGASSSFFDTKVILEKI